MATESLISSTEVGQKGLVRQAKRLMQNLRWLRPAALLASRGGREFGRNIETSLRDVRAGEVIRLQLRRNDAAVVMSLDHYEEIMLMKSVYAEMVSRVQEQDIAAAADDYEALFRRITSARSRKAADDLFVATSEDLRRTYRPGETERQ